MTSHPEWCVEHLRAGIVWRGSMGFQCIVLCQACGTFAREEFLSGLLKLDPGVRDCASSLYGFDDDYEH